MELVEGPVVASAGLARAGSMALCRAPGSGSATQRHLCRIRERCKPGNAHRIADHLGFEEAAAVPSAFFTGWQTLIELRALETEPS